MGDFEIDAVLYYMISKGGRVRNHELVTHFKNFLNHSVNKVQNREKFKDYVNELAAIKIDAGEKILVLKKKYRPPSENIDPAQETLPSFRSSQPGSKSGGDSRKVVASEPDLSVAQSSSSSTAASTFQDGRSAQSDSLRAHSEPPNVVSEGLRKDMDTFDGLTMSKVSSDEAMEVTMRRTDRIPPAEPVKDDVNMNSITSSNASLTSGGSQKSSTSGVTSMDEDANASVISVKDKIMKLNKNISESDISQPNNGSSNGGNKKSYKHSVGDDDDSSHSSGSFMTLDEEQRDWLVVCSYSEYHDMNRLLSKNPGLAKLRDFTNFGISLLHSGHVHKCSDSFAISPTASSD